MVYLSESVRNFYKINTQEELHTQKRMQFDKVYNIDTALMPIEPTIVIYSERRNYINIMIEVSSLSLNAPQTIHLFIYCYQKLCELVNVQTMNEVQFEV